MKSPIVHSVWLFMAGGTLLFSLNVCEYTWAKIVGVMMIVGIVSLIACIRSFGRGYRMIHTSSAVSTMVALMVAAIGINCFSKGQYWLALLQACLVVINIVSVVYQKAAIRRRAEIDAHFQAWLDAHFPGRKVGDGWDTQL